MKKKTPQSEVPSCSYPLPPDPSSSYPPPPPNPSSSHMKKAVQALAVRDDFSRITILVTNLCKGKMKTDGWKHIYKCFSDEFPSSLVVKLLQLYRFANVSPEIRSYSLSLLDSHLVNLEDSRTALDQESLREIKEHLDACLLLQETSDQDFKLLSRIISRVAVDIFLENIDWGELNSYIHSLNHDHMKTLFIFSELPMILEEEFVMPLIENNLKVKILKGLSDPDSDEEWCLALLSGFNLALHLMSMERRDLVFDVAYAIGKSVWEMVNLRKREIAVRKGIMTIESKVRREAFRFGEAEYEFVSSLALMLKGTNGIEEETVIAAKKIREVLEKYYMGGQFDLDFAQRLYSQLQKLTELRL